MDSITLKEAYKIARDYLITETPIEPPQDIRFEEAELTSDNKYRIVISFLNSRALETQDTMTRLFKATPLADYQRFYKLITVDVNRKEVSSIKMYENR